MAETTISPNMSLPIPTVGEAPGPGWATNIDSCLTILDAHNHTAGSGVPITPEAIDINADLNFNGQNAYDLRSVRLQNQSAAISEPADLGCIYESGGELFYNDASGNQVQLTDNGSPAGATGTITGLPSGTASASFAGTTFTFNSATNTPATMYHGPLRLGKANTSGIDVLISCSGSQVADYSLTLPVGLPTVLSDLQSDASGNLSFVANVANVRSSEGAGTTTLTSSDSSWQIFNLSAARTVLLPTTGIVSGQKYVIENVGNGVLTVQSSGAETVGLVDSKYAKLELVALTNTPTTAAHWLANLSYSDNVYSHGGTYNSGLAPTITLNAGGGTLSNVRQADFIPYQALDGKWFCKFNIYCTLSSTARSSVQLAVADILFYNNSGDGQAVNGLMNGSATFVTSICENNSNLLTVNYSTSVTNTAVWFSGDVRLASKPGWAY